LPSSRIASTLKINEELPVSMTLDSEFL